MSSGATGYRMVPMAVFAAGYRRRLLRQDHSVRKSFFLCANEIYTEANLLSAHSFWNTTTSARLNSLVTPSQVTSLRFNPHSREILSSHGFPDNQLSIWSFPSLSKIVDITQAHDTRVLHSCLSPDGTTVATASSDENLKFWKVFELPKKTASSAGVVGGMFPGKGVSEGKEDFGRRGRTGIAIR